MKLYVAASFKDITYARCVMELLKRDGHEITHNWTIYEADRKDDFDYLQECGKLDYRGVYEADALVLVNHTEARDALIETGIALGLGKPVFLLHPSARVSVFTSFMIRADTMRDLRYLLRGAKYE